VRGVENLIPTRREFNAALVASLLDASGMVCSVLGMKYAGSGLMSVIYASLPAFTAVLRYFWMGRSISKVRLVCMATVMLGLSIVPLAEGLHFNSDSSALMFGEPQSELCFLPYKTKQQLQVLWLHSLPHSFMLCSMYLWSVPWQSQRRTKVPSLWIPCV
jgi:drug/metabolite transporter (DMT)-like permease